MQVTQMTRRLSLTTKVMICHADDKVTRMCTSNENDKMTLMSNEKVTKMNASNANAKEAITENSGDV